VGTALANIGLAQQKQGDRVGAMDSFERALAIHEAAYGRDHPSIAYTLNNLAVVLDELQRPADALPLYRRALAIREHTVGPEHPYVAQTLANIGLSLQISGEHEQAIESYLRALAIFEKHDAPDAVQVRQHLSDAELRVASQRWTKGDHAAAIGFAERARDHAGTDPSPQRDAAEQWLREHRSDR
ncbi:MAG TPA: tetratricopeptide repeat protein, partial [Nannocystaceae bacterium]|nr:tetratricopeptide repeat protein [Nannocystaceae bacterium]